MTVSATEVPRLALHDGAEIPQIGFGTFQIPQAETTEAVLRALEAGYRHIDTASVYGNEAEVGHALRASGLDRSEIFLTTKCWNSDQGHEESRRAFAASLERLEVDHLDLYLIHWPVPARDRYVETWNVLAELREEGQVRSIGVSNFQAPHLARIVDETGVTPVVNQIELHPRLQQAGLRREHADRQIVTEAWSPLAQGGVIDDPVLTGIADDHDRTAAQVALRWHLQLGNVVIPKSATPARIAENIDILSFHLSPAEMERIAALDAGARVGPDPDTFGRG